jgi:hypothetical protein
MIKGAFLQQRRPEPLTREAGQSVTFLSADPAFRDNSMLFTRFVKDLLCKKHSPLGSPLTKIGGNYESKADSEDSVEPLHLGDACRSIG